MHRSRAPVLLAAPAALALACATGDNPTALDARDTQIELVAAASTFETFEEQELVFHVEEGGRHLHLLAGEVEIEHHATGVRQVIQLSPAHDGEGYEAHVTFFQEGEHHIHLMGMPERHTLMGELGEVEVDVEAQHHVAGAYLVELEISPAPPVAGEEAHVHLHIHGLNPDGTKGAPAAGLTVTAKVHAAAGETPLTAAEEDPGEYELAYTFAGPGLYELHVEIDTAAGPVEAEFHIHLPALDEDEPEETGGGHGHGH